MLEVFFCNVGDGDATLLTERRSGAPDYTILVDAGRPYLEPKNGSLRKEAIYYLKQRGVDHLDRMILTHLHIDHIGGAQRILEAMPVRTLTLPVLPPQDAAWVAPPFASLDKAANGLCCMLNILTDLVRAAVKAGCRVETASAGKQPLTERLSLETILPKSDAAARQGAVFDALWHGAKVDYDVLYRTAKERNLVCLMQRFRYAGRSVLLTGDRYGFDWEDEPVPPCDILKLPHHGDRKSMTEPLLLKLAPSYAVVSCQNDPNAKKERPEAAMLAMVQRHVPTVLCTENRALLTLPAATHNGIRFTISDGGAIACETE